MLIYITLILPNFGTDWSKGTLGRWNVTRECWTLMMLQTCFSPLFDASSFLILYIVMFVYFCSAMVRILLILHFYLFFICLISCQLKLFCLTIWQVQLMLVLAPTACILSEIALSEAFDVFARSNKFYVFSLFENTQNEVSICNHTHALL